MPSQLFTPIDLRDLTLPNRVAVSPMCQYMARDGVPTDWHLVHLGQFAQSGPGLVMVEATGVEPEGRITPGCPGLWDDAQEAAFAPILAFCGASATAKLGIQLAHAGRKASTLPPWEGGGPVRGARRRWVTKGPSAVALHRGLARARRARRGGDRGDRRGLRGRRRAARCGSASTSWRSTRRTATCCTSSCRRSRTAATTAGAARSRAGCACRSPCCARCARRSPRGCRSSCGSRPPTGSRAAGTSTRRSSSAARCARRAATWWTSPRAGNDPRQQIPVGPGYQTAFAARIRAEAGIPTMAVGMITDAVQAETDRRHGAGRHGGAGPRDALGPPLGLARGRDAGRRRSSPPPPTPARTPRSGASPFLTRP